MTMHKKATFSHKCKITALNKPKGDGWDIFNLPNQIKTASIDVSGEDLNGFDIKEATKEHPDHLYIKIFAIREDEPNDNGDSFSGKELKKAANTFVGVPLFTNHQNDDVEKARGDCVHSWYDKEAGGIYIIGRVDKIAYPRLARGIESGYIDGTSMGCSVESSCCSVCHNKSNVADDYCTHISNKKNRKYNGDMKCAYHNSPTDKDEKCPLCGSTKDDIKILKHSEQQIFEHNYGLKFIENSFVVNPACHDCGVKCVLNVPEVQKKVASLQNVVKKLYADSDEVFTSDSDIAKAIQKIGGVKELDSLKNSMSEMEAVVKSMLKQKDNVSMEYVSDIVKAMSDIQGIFDELIEMGYGALPSPEVVAGAEDAPVVTDTPSQPLPPQGIPQPQPLPQSPGSQTSDMGGLGNITMPKSSSKNKEDFSKLNQSIINKVGSLEETLSDLNKNINSKLEIGAKMAIDNKKTKTAAGTENLDVITEKQLGKQGEDLHPRTEETYEGITESKEQLGGSEKSNDTTSDSPQIRKGTYETITEDQLKTQSALGDAVIHFNDYPDVITEKQWTDFSKEVSGDLPSDYTEAITQSQIRDLLSKHKFVGDLETITEDQLKNMSMTDGLDRWANKEYALSLVKIAENVVADLISTYRKSPEEIKKISSVVNDNSDIKSKVSFLAVLNSLPHKTEDRKAIASNVAYFNKTASKSGISTIDALIFASADNAEFGVKAEDIFDTIHHIVENKISMAKVDTIVRNKNNKTNSGFTTKADALNQAIKTMDKPEDGKYRIKATMEDIGVPITEKVAFIHSVKKFAQEMIDDDSVAAAVIKIEATPTGELIIDIQDGAEEEVCPDDIGDIIEGPVEEIDADINGEESVGDGEIVEVEIEEDGEDDGEEEKDMSFAKSKDKVVEAQKEIKKTAQMMGGEMGGMGGASQAPGAGATLPSAPGMGTPPVESFTEEPGLGDEEGGMSDNLEPLPPGSICPVCGSDDVDVISGKGKCNNCSSEMTYKVEVNVTRWEGITPSEDETQVEEEGFEGEGFEMPTTEEMGAGEPGVGGEAMGEMPSAASTDNWKVNKFAATIRIKPEAVKIAANNDIKIGSVSPATGTTNTVSLGDGKYMCLDTGTKYKVAYMVSKDGKQVYGQWEWNPKIANAICPSCSRAKQKFVKALSSVKMTEADFDKMELKEQVETIIKLKKAGSLKTIKTASKEGSVFEDYKLAYGGYGKKFPIESCIEKLARRFGENAICLSGPDEGKPLAESVCSRLKGADIYTSKIASKLADSWSDCDGDEECVTHQVRSGYSLREAAEVCTTLKIAVADGEDFLADEIAGDVSIDEGPVDEMGGEDVVDGVDEVDPFEGGIGEDVGGTVTLELPIDIVEQLDAKLDEALGENPAEEEHHDDLDSDGVPDIIDESPVGEDVIPEEVSVEEEIAPGELDETKDMGMKPMEVGFEEQQGDGTDIVEKKEGFPGETSKTNITVNGNPVNAKIETGLSIKEAMNMSGGIGKIGKAQMDLSGVINTLNKMAGEKEISQSKAQDSTDIGTYTAGEGGSLMGHESDTIRTPKKPSVPRDSALMGQEDSDLNPQDKPQPVIPSDKATMGHEDEAGLSGGDNSYTGGDKGQGKTELASADEELMHYKGFGNSKDGLARLTERISKKLAPKEPVADDKDIQPISDGNTIGKEEKFDAEEINESEIKSDSGMIGHEKESLESKPDSPKDHPDVNTGNAQMGKEELDSEKTVKNKGTVIAGSDTESEAIRVAGKMLQAKKIEASELASKISELKTYKPEQIKDFEKSIFAGEKGLDTVADGKLSQTVQINEASSVMNKKDELSSKLSSMFTLGKQNKVADDDDLTQTRQIFK